MDNQLIIELKNITKTFGSVVANKNVNLQVKNGEILALLGENGSGKTTLMNMLSGIYMPDSGEIFVNGEKVSINNPEESKKLGIGMVHQHFKLVDNFNAVDNIWMGVECDTFGLKEKLKEISNDNKKNDIKSKFSTFGKHLKTLLEAGKFKLSQQMLIKNRYSKVDNVIAKFGFNLDSKKKVSEMAVSEKQTLEIIKILYYGAKIIILDEPTAVLTVQEIAKFFDILRKMKATGHSIIIITHKLNEIMEITDRVAIMRKGEYITTVNTSETNEKQLTELMMGCSAELVIERPLVEKTPPILEVKDLQINNDEGLSAIDNVSFYIRQGEILGVAGISGCGQKELCEAIAGLRKINGGMILHKGDNIVGKSPKEIIKKGIAMSFIPEDRLGMGLAPSLSIVDNMLLKDYKNGNIFNPFVNRKRARIKAKEIIEKLRVVTPSADTPVRRLSGGNVQKVLVGREIQSGPNVIITAYPVRGLDINSAYAIYDILNKEKIKGVGILFVGEDLDVLMALCDKIMVICHGKIMGIVNAHKVSKEEIGLMMTGSLDLIKDNNEKLIGIAKDSKYL